MQPSLGNLAFRKPFKENDNCFKAPAYHSGGDSIRVLTISPKNQHQPLSKRSWYTFLGLSNAPVKTLQHLQSTKCMISSIF